jgi:hypothetical protein
MKRIALVTALIVVAAVSFAQDWSADSSYGSVNLSSGFMPDPYTVSLTAGGSISAYSLGNGTAGNIANAPDFDLYYNAGSYTLYIYVVSSADTTLVINTPSGRWVGNDDYTGLNPCVVFSSPDSGLYNIWVGTIGNSYADATLYISEMPPGSGSVGSSSSSSSGPDWSADPTYGSVELSAGFMPDPYQIAISAGGSNYAGSYCMSCAGYVATAPDLDVYYNAGGYPLYIYVQSNSDTTLLINGPDGEWYGSDDVMGANPMVIFNPPQSGLYDIWVGTYSSGSYQNSTLYVSEMDPRGGK